ncbi:MAG: CehA/McbA family metallohydrolase, partial [Spirochaetaceae bacterium]|nr:CehA/McbA family metallohydrolase [Spirochaetaceae bacterium]
MTTVIRLDRSYGASNSRSYERLAFEVPEGIGRIDVEYSYPRRSREEKPEGLASRETCVLDLGLYDEQGFMRGWSGSQRSSVFVSGESATPGYRSGPIRSGIWAVALGIYRVQGTVVVQVEITLHPKKERFLAGDLHVHTLNSDGDYPTAEVIEQCKAAGLDFVALTDHNNTAQNEEIGRPEGILVLPGMEYTNYRGHANFFFRGPSDFRNDLLSRSREDMLAVLGAARAMGALVSVNHPFCDLCPWEFGLDALGMDLVEIWNGPMKESDMRAVAWWHSLLSTG